MSDYPSPENEPKRYRLPPERKSVTHKFVVGEMKGYLTMGFYPDGKIGEIFIEVEKQGSAMSGILGAFGRSVSMGLQHGISLDHFIHSFKYMRFAPEGFMGNPYVRNARSIMDYIFRYMEGKTKDGFLVDAEASDEK